MSLGRQDSGNLIKRVLMVFGGVAMLVSAVGWGDGAASAATPARLDPGASSVQGCIVGLNCGCIPRRTCGRQVLPWQLPPPPPAENGNNDHADGGAAPAIA